MISLIATVLNEGDNIRVLCDSILAGTRQPDDIVFVDGGSVDDTVAILREYSDRLPLRVIEAPGCNISGGRNIAIRAARGDIIAVTDAGVRLEARWLERLCEPLLHDASAQVVAGFFLAAPTTPFEAALGAVTLPALAEIDPDAFLPSSRSIAFRKSAAEKADLYPEWLDFCEDLIFDLRLRALQGPFTFAPDAIVYFRPRATPGKFFRQYFCYARGDGKADLWRKRHAIRYAVYLLFLPLILALALLHHPLWLGFSLISGGAYLVRPCRRLPANMKRLGRVNLLTWLYCLALLPFLRALGDSAKMLGYPVGWRWRLRRRPPNWHVGEK